MEALGISQHEAIGVLVQFWGSVSQHATHGYVAAFPDAQLEAWAGWTKKRGKFAKFVREHHLDPQGVVNEWDEYAGALEDRKEKDRRRKRKSRGVSTGRHADSPQDVTPMSAPTIRNDTRRDEVVLHLHHPSPAEADAETRLAAMLETDADRVALTAVVSRASDRIACIAAFTAMLTGNDPATPQPSAEVFGQALRDYAANGERPATKLFRGYLRDAAKPRREVGEPFGGRAAGSNGNGASREHWTDKKAREEREESDRNLIRIRAGNVEQRRGKMDGEAWYARMKLEAKSAGANVTLYAYDRLHELAEAEHAHV
jgi:hypothetical protein